MNSSAATHHDVTTAVSTPALPEWATTYDEGRLLHNKPFRSVCYAPFTTLEFGQTGDVIVCCANNQNVVGNVRIQSIKEIWRGPAIQAIRMALKNYQFASGCHKCVWQIAHGDFSTTFSKKDDVYPFDQSWEQGPQKMEFRLSNACNLACVMCCGEYSSTIRREVEHLPPLDCSYPDTFFEELADYIPHLRYASFTGGEPFLVHNNYRVWDLIVDRGRHVKCRLITNGTILTPKVRDYLERLQLADLCVSIDGATKATFERIRRGASFEQVMQNLDYFAAYCRRRRTNLRILVCGLAANWRELPEIFLLARRFGASVWTNIVQRNPLRTPETAVGLLEMSEPQQREVAVYLARRFDDIKEYLDEESRHNYQIHLNLLGGPTVVPNTTTGGPVSIW